MKRTYKLLGYLLLGIGAYAFLNANNTDLQAKQRISADLRLRTRKRLGLLKADSVRAQGALVAKGDTGAKHRSQRTTGDASASRPATQQQTSRKRNRHTITLVLSQLSDLKVEEGQRINIGDIISDRTTEKTKLYA